MLLAFVGIKVHFDEARMNVVEGIDFNRTAPKLLLDKPSPCCIVIRAELVDDTAVGELCNVRMYVCIAGHKNKVDSGEANLGMVYIYIYIYYSSF